MRRRKIFRPRKYPCLVARRIFPTMLYAYLAGLQRGIYPQFDHKGLCFKLFLSRDLLRSFREDVLKALFKAAALHSLPLPVIISIEKDRVLGRDDSCPLRQREHLVLHYGLHFASD